MSTQQVMDCLARFVCSGPSKAQIGVTTVKNEQMCRMRGNIERMEFRLDERGLCAHIVITDPCVLQEQGWVKIESQIEHVVPLNLLAVLPESNDTHLSLQERNGTHWLDFAYYRRPGWIDLSTVKARPTPRRPTHHSHIES